MAPASNEEQFKFLISCIRYSNNGKVDFGQVARECKIVSKGAAAKRYERMMRSHGIAPNAATVKQGPNRSLKAEQQDSLNHSYSTENMTGPSNANTKKRKTDQFLEDMGTADDDEGYGGGIVGGGSVVGNTIKAETSTAGMRDSKEGLFVKHEGEAGNGSGYTQQNQYQHLNQLSLNDATNLLQYYDTPTPSSGSYGGGADMGAEDLDLDLYGGGDGTTGLAIGGGGGAGYGNASAMVGGGGTYGMHGGQQRYNFGGGSGYQNARTPTYGSGGMASIPRSESQIHNQNQSQNQGMPMGMGMGARYQQPLIRYSNDNKGRPESPLIVE